jgi:acetyltransferase-like isoleucine patch superfamily enzyme
MKYFIIGNGGFAKEVLFICKQIFGSIDEFGGFIDYKPEFTQAKCMGYDLPVIDEDEFLSIHDLNCYVYIGAGDPKTIKKIADKFKDYTFPNLIHNNVVIDESVKLNKGNIVTGGCVLTVDINIGNFNVFNLNTTVGHDTIIGDCNVFNPGANISGSVNIGNFNLFGTNSTILQGLKIGNNSIIGASSLINKFIDSNLVVVGIPAKEIKKND